MVVAAGWPGRSGRVAFSPGDMEDEKKTENPITALDAAGLDLTFWNAGGLGLALPKLVMVVDQSIPQLLYAAFAWDQDQVYTNVGTPFPWTTFTDNGVGDYRLAFDAAVPGLDGVMQPLLITGGIAQAHGAAAGRRVDFELVDPQTVDIKIVTAYQGGAGSAPVDDSFLVVAW